MNENIERWINTLKENGWTELGNKDELPDFAFKEGKIIVISPEPTFLEIQYNMGGEWKRYDKFALEQGSPEFYQMTFNNIGAIRVKLDEWHSESHILIR